MEPDSEPKSRRRFSFSLRTLLVVVTVGCLMGGVFARFQVAKARRIAMDTSDLVICFTPVRSTSAWKIFVSDLFDEFVAKSIYLGAESSTLEDQRRFQRLFPEARVVRIPLEELIAIAEDRRNAVCIPSSSELCSYVK